MSEAGNEIVIIHALIVVVLATLIAFLSIQYQQYNPKATAWNALNAFAVFTIVLTLGALIPQYFIIGRSPTECSLLHHFAGSFAVLTEALSQTFFLCRSNQVGSHNRLGKAFGNAILITIVISTVLSLIFLNLTMKTSVIPTSQICVVELDIVVLGLFGILIPKTCKILINIRFAWNIVATTKSTESGHDSHWKGPRRLLIVTFVMCFATLIVSLTEVVLLSGAMIKLDPWMMTTLIAFTQVFETCSMAWPAIIIRVLKCVRSRPRTLTTPSPATF